MLLLTSIGFVTFCSVESADKALVASPEQLILDGRFNFACFWCPLSPGLRNCRTLQVKKPQVPKRHKQIAIQCDEQCLEEEGLIEEVHCDAAVVYCEGMDDETAHCKVAGCKEAEIDQEHEEVDSSRFVVCVCTCVVIMWSVSVYLVAGFSMMTFSCTYSHTFQWRSDWWQREVGYWTDNDLSSLISCAVSRQWKRVGVRWWKTVRVLSFDGIFVSFKGRHSGMWAANVHGDAAYIII